jgi:hypothetical protein
MVLDVQGDPFLGIVCHTCTHPGGGLPSGGRVSIKTAIHNHFLRFHQTANQVPDYEHCLTSISRHVEHQLSEMAGRHSSSADEPSRAQILMVNRFHHVETVHKCAHCGALKRHTDNHSLGRHSKDCRADGQKRDLIQGQFHCVTRSVFIESGKCSDFVLHRFFRVYKARIRLLEGVDCDTFNTPMENTDTIKETSIASSLPSVAPSKKFNSFDFHPSILTGFVHGLSVGQETVRDHHKFYHQIEHHLMKGSSQPILAQFVCEHYESLVVTYFDGDWTRYADFFHKQLHGERLPWESKLHSAATDMFKDQYTTLRQVNPQFRTEIQTVGLYRPRSEMYGVVEKCRTYLRDQLAEESTEDDGYQPTDAQPMQMLVEDIIAIVDESESASSGIPKLLSPAGCEKTRDGYCRTMGDYVIFLVRMYSNGFCGGVSTRNEVRETVDALFPEYPGGSELDNIHRIQGFAMQLLIGSLHIEEKQSYVSMMETGVSLAELYCLGLAVKRQTLEESTVYFNFKGPATVHAAASRLFYSLRIAACGACVHAARVGELGLQQLLVGPKVFTNSSTWIALARLQKSTKGYESKLEEGLEPAKTSVSTPGTSIPDIFSITHSTRQDVVIITRSMFSNSVRACHREITRFTRLIIQMMRNHKLNAYHLNQDSHCVLDLGIESVYEAFETSLLSCLPTFHDPGHYKVIEVPSVVGGERKSTVFASTLSCVYLVVLDDGCQVQVASTEVARLLSCLMRSEVNLSLLVDAHYKVAVILGTLLTFSLRGSPRDSEILRFRCGVTNKWFARNMKCDLMGSNAPGSDVKDELLVRFNRLKYGGGGSGSSSLLMAPDVLALGMNNYLSLMRTALLLHMVEEKHELSQLCNLTTGMFRRVELGDNGLVVLDWGRFSESIEDYFNSVMGMSKGTFSLRMMRQVVAGVSQVLTDNTNRLRKAMTERTRVNASNHQVATHKRYYQLGVRLDETRVSLADFDEGRLQDKQTAEYLGCPQVCRSADAAVFGNRSWRRLRLASDSIAYGCLKFGADLNYCKRRPVQNEMFSEASSSLRDSLFNYPCGSGKTALAYSLCIYAFACDFARTNRDLTSKITSLATRLDRCHYRNTAQCLELAKTILKDKDVSLFLNYCEKDTRPPPTKLLNLVLVPYSNTVRGVINEINKKQLVRAVDFDAELLMECVVDSQKYGIFTGSFDFDVMVCTISKAVMEENACVIERAMESGIVGCEVIDEVHVVLTNCEWMTDMNLVRGMRRHGVPLLAMTGTLQKGLEVELVQALLCNAGVNSAEITSRCVGDNIYNGTNLGTKERNTVAISFRKKQGFYRAACTLPNHIAISFQEATGSENAMVDEAVNTMFRARDSDSFFRAESALIICATRSQADRCFQRASNHTECNLGISILKGRESKSAVDQFHKEFTQGDNYAGIVTSVGAQSLDKKNLNLVIILSLCYSGDLLAQAVARAGRSMQRSLVIYIHHDQLTQSIRKNYTQAPFGHIEAMIGGLDVALMKKYLSPYSLTNFIYCAENDCHWEKLRETIDDDTNHDIYKNSEWCCSNCNPRLSRYVHTVWNPGRKIHNHIPRGQIQPISPTAAKRKADEMETCSTPSTLPRQSKRPEVPQSRRLLANSSTRGSNIFSDRVRSFVTCQDSFNKLKKNCVWHIGLHLHQPKDTQIWSVSTCRKHFCLFIGLPGTTSCFKCGGLPKHCGGGSQCALKKFEFISFASSKSVCLQCAVYHSVGAKHQKTNCASDRMFGLVVWALRSDKGHQQMMKQWDICYKNQLDLSYPKKVPFRAIDDSLISSWKNALQFVVAKESLNRAFWTCVVLSIKETGYVNRLC